MFHNLFDWNTYSVRSINPSRKLIMACLKEENPRATNTERTVSSEETCFYTSALFSVSFQHKVTRINLTSLYLCNYTRCISKGMHRKHLKYPKPQKFDLPDYPAPIPPPLAMSFFTLWDKGHTTYNIFADSCSPLTSRPTTWDIWAFSRAGEPGRAQELRHKGQHHLPLLYAHHLVLNCRSCLQKLRALVQRLPDLWNSTAGSGCSFCMFFFLRFSLPQI